MNEVQQSINNFENAKEIVLSFKDRGETLSRLILLAQNPTDLKLKDWSQLLRNTWLASS
ncbi:MAG: hypothetical protein AAGF07_02775 [Patescibacteria group bacterium]